MPRAGNAESLGALSHVQSRSYVPAAFRDHSMPLAKCQLTGPVASSLFVFMCILRFSRSVKQGQALTAAIESHKMA